MFKVQGEKSIAKKYKPTMTRPKRKTVIEIGGYGQSGIIVASANLDSLD